MTSRVPNVTRQVPPEPPTVLPEGTYDAVIERVDEPVALKSNPAWYRVPFILRVKGQLVWVNYSGFPETVIMLYRNRQHWIGRTVKVKLRIREHQGHQYNDARILWELNDV